MRDKRPCPPCRGIFVLCRSEKILAESGGVLLAFQECRMESEVDDALEPLHSDEVSSRVLQASVAAFLSKKPDDECLSQAIGTLGICFRTGPQGFMRTVWGT